MFFFSEDFTQFYVGDPKRVNVPPEFRNHSHVSVVFAVRSSTVLLIKWLTENWTLCAKKVIGIILALLSSLNLWLLDKITKLNTYFIFSSETRRRPLGNGKALCISQGSDRGGQIYPTLAQGLALDSIYWQLWSSTKF